MRNTKKVLKDFLPAVAVLISGIALSILVFDTVHSHYKGADQQNFQRDSAFYGTSFKNEVDRHVASLAAIHAFVSASHNVDRWEFSAFANQILPQNSGFKAILWVPRVGQAQRKTFERELQRDGLYGLRIRDLTDRDQIIDAAERPDYLPVAFVQPFEGNGNIAGIDLSADPIYAQLFRAAQQTRGAAATPPVSRALVETTGSPVVIVAFPLIQGVGTIGNEFSQSPKGYALGVLQLDHILKDSIASRTVNLLAAVVYGDRNVMNAIVSDQSGKTASVKNWFKSGKFNRTVPFDIAGQHFQLVMRSADRDDTITLFYVPLGSALLVLAITALLFQSMLATILGKRTVELAVEVRTAELRALNAALSGEIEHRKETEAELRISKKKAEAASRSKSIFLSTMSHELRTPLNAIIGFSELLITKVFKEERSADYLSEIHGSGKKLLNLINDILDIAQLDVEETRKFELVYLPEIIAIAMESEQPFADAAGISLACTLPRGLTPVRGDARRLQKLLINLLTNSIKFGREGGWAQITVVQEAQTLILAVSDNGIGMPPDAETRISELFSQFDGSLNRRYEGVGLGLTFVRKVAELHGASFRIKSGTGEGTTVTLSFPVSGLDLMANVA